MSGTYTRNMRTAPPLLHTDPFVPARLRNQRYLDPFVPPLRMRNENPVHPPNSEYGYQRSHHGFPKFGVRSGTDQRISGRSSSQRDRNERIIRDVEETLEPILKFTDFPKGFLINVLLPCIPSEKAAILVAGVLLCAAKRKGTCEIGKLWREYQLTWEDLFGTHSIMVEDFIKKNNLEFTVCPKKVMLEPVQPIQRPIEDTMPMEEIKKKPIQRPIQDTMPMEEIKKTLLRLFKTNKVNEIIFDWIDANVSRNEESIFIRVLVSAVLESVISGSGMNCDLDAYQLNIRTPLLSRYIARNELLELQALYAVQSLMNELRHPNGLLRQIFDILYDADLITEEAFKTWESSTDPYEAEGKDIAAHSVKSFFTWLRETESGEETDE